jgi:hypothetical protein
MVNLFVVIFMTYASYILWTCTICGLCIYIPVFFCDAHIIVLKSEDITYQVLAWPKSLNTMICMAKKLGYGHWQFVDELLCLSVVSDLPPKVPNQR